MKESDVLIQEFRILPDMKKGAGFAEAIMLEKGIVPGKASLLNHKGSQTLRDLFRNFPIYSNTADIHHLLQGKCFIAFWHQKLMKDYV